MDLKVVIEHLDAISCTTAAPETDFCAGFAMLQRHAVYKHWRQDYVAMRDAFYNLQTCVNAVLAARKKNERTRIEIDDVKHQLVAYNNTVKEKLASARLARTELEGDAVFIHCLVLSKMVTNGQARLDKLIQDKTDEWVERAQSWQVMLE